MTDTEIALIIALLSGWIGTSFLLRELAVKAKKISKLETYVKRARKEVHLGDNITAHLIINTVLEIIYENE